MRNNDYLTFLGIAKVEDLLAVLQGDPPGFRDEWRDEDRWFAVNRVLDAMATAIRNIANEMEARK